MPIATVAGFNVTPVKSTALHHPDAIDLRREGAVGDRRFLFARPDGTRLRGVSKAPLIPIVATWLTAEEHLTLRLADSTVVEGSALPSGKRVDVKLFDRTISAHPITRRSPRRSRPTSTRRLGCSASRNPNTPAGCTEFRSSRSPPSKTWGCEAPTRTSIHADSER
jgi:hypothetical protein